MLRRSLRVRAAAEYPSHMLYGTKFFMQDRIVRLYYADYVTPLTFLLRLIYSLAPMRIARDAAGNE